MKKYGIFAILLLSGIFPEVQAMTPQVRQQVRYDLARVASELKEDACNDMIIGAALLFTSVSIGAVVGYLCDDMKFSYATQTGLWAGGSFGLLQLTYLTFASTNKSVQSARILDALNKI